MGDVSAVPAVGLGYTASHASDATREDKGKGREIVEEEDHGGKGKEEEKIWEERGQW